MAFRGYGDDAMAVRKDKRATQVKLAQIAAQERASRRAAGVQMAQLQEGARQADMRADIAVGQLQEGGRQADTRAGIAVEQIKEGARQADTRADIAVGQMEMTDNFNKRKEALDRDIIEIKNQHHEEAMRLKLEEVSQKERQLRLNEEVASRLDAEWAQKQAIQEELQNEDKAIQLAVVRAASLSSGPLDAMWLNRINDHRGVAYGDPGSVTQVFPIIDNNTGARLGVGTESVDKDGNKIQSVLDPADIVLKIRESMRLQEWGKFAQNLTGGNTANMSDKFTAAVMKELQKESVLKFGNLDFTTTMAYLDEEGNKSRGELKKNPSSSEATAQLEKIDQIKKNVIDQLEKYTKITPEIEPLTAAQLSTASAIKNPSTGKIAITIDGKTVDAPDTPAIRDWIAGIGMQITEGGE